MNESEVADTVPLILSSRPHSKLGSISSIPYSSSGGPMNEPGVARTISNSEFVDIIAFPT
jgi:hypothetical protein